MPFRKITLAICCLALPILASAQSAVQQPSSQAVKGALNGYQFALKKHKVKNTHYMGIVDFSKPSYQQRFYVYDLHRHKAVYSTLVAQGKGSGVGPYAKHFSNNFHTHMSSLGVFVTTGGNYPSHHGRSIHVEGLQPGINSNANRRTVEIHSAWYVSPSFAAKNHRVGNSFGCFAVSKQAIGVLRPDIGNGSVLYAYYS